MEKLNKLSLPATILIASIVLGGFYYASQVIKQNSIERQQQIEIEQKKQEQLNKELKEQQTKEEAAKQAQLNKQFLDNCLGIVAASYIIDFKNDCKANGLAEDCSLPTDILKILEDKYKDEKAECFKKYPQN